MLIVSLKSCIIDKTYRIVISLLYALGCGAMIGGAMIHLLPDAYGNSEINSNYVSLVFICAVVAFILVERIFACCGISHAHCDNPTLEIHDHDLTGQGNCEQVHVKKCTGESGGKIEIDNIQDEMAA